MAKPGMTLEAASRATGEVELVGKLGGLTLTQQVITLAMWPLLENVLAFFVGLTDLLISGRMAEGAERVAILDAMGLGGYVGWFFNILQGAVATGVMALVSRATGARDEPLANRGLGQGLWLGVAAGIGSLVILQVGIPLLIRQIGLSPEAGVQAEKFLRVLAWSGPISGAMFAINAALRAAGDTRTPFLAMVIVNVVNMGVSWMLVFGPAPFGGHGIAGIATGTVTGWVCGFLTSFLMLGHGRSAALKWTRFGLTPHWDTMKRILRVGAPQSLEILVMWLIHAYGIHVIAKSAIEGSLGAHMLAIRVESMSFLPGFAIATAAAALTGQYLGAGSKPMAVKAVRLCWKMAVGLMSLIGLCFVFFRYQLIGIMAPGSEFHAHMGAPLLIVSAITQPFFATCIILKTSMRGAGATVAVMRWSFGSMIFYRVGVLWWFFHHGGISLTAVWIVLGMDLFTQAIAFTWLHFRGTWLDARV
ncbi:MATE family efflux transporter [Luteolibacter sp. LG18]|uniref:MATE family efflux transporter n=1 Tax=Luteolibacter sp. LG18 TaxID=2819286 RepID=UPI0030C6E76F